MATVQERNARFRVLSCPQGKRHTLNLGKISRKEADRKSEQIDYLLLRIKQRLLTVPMGVPIEEFLLHDGQVKTVGQVTASGPVSFADFKKRYLETHQHGAMEAGSLDTVAMHLKHFERALGEKFPLQELSPADLQQHVTSRRQKKYRGKPLSPVTLRKEMASFRAAWNWAANMGIFR